MVDRSWNALQHLVLPALVLAAFNVGLLTRYTRSAVLEVTRTTTCARRARRACPERTVILRHVLRAALPSVITVIGLAFAQRDDRHRARREHLLAGPASASTPTTARPTLDLPAIMGVSLFVAVVYIVVNFVVDVLYGVIDPRIRIA